MNPTDSGRKRAKTDDEKEQRRIERVLRNRAAAQTSRERKRLEMEKLENEKIQMEQQNQFLLSRLSQMEAENNRLNQQVARLSAEVRGSRCSSPKPAASPITTTESPTLTPTLFKQERDDHLPLERIPFPTPSVHDYSPTLKPSTLAAPAAAAETPATDATQHPAAMLCDLQCPSAMGASRCSTPAPAQAITMWQLLCLTMTSAAFSTVIHPLSRILRSLKTGSPLAVSSTEEISSRLFPLIQWLISTPTLSSSTTTTTTTATSNSTSKNSKPPIFRMRLLARLLACSPALARPLRDATGRALQLAVSEGSLPRESQSGSAADAEGPVAVVAGRQSWEFLITMIWAIDSIQRGDAGRRSVFSSSGKSRSWKFGRMGKRNLRRSSRALSGV